MIDIGIASGEINPSDRALVAEFMRIVLTALTDAGSTSAEPHRRSIDALDALLHGRLIRPVPGAEITQARSAGPYGVWRERAIRAPSVSTRWSSVAVRPDSPRRPSCRLVAGR